MVKRLLLLLFVLIVGYLLLAPVRMDPAVWVPPQRPKLEGPFAQNDKLKAVQLIFPECHECEDVAVDSSGHLYAGSVDGNIYQYNLQTGRHDVFAKMDGRPLGLHLDSVGNLLVADAGSSLKLIDDGGQSTDLCGSLPGFDLKIIDDLETGQDGKVYFSNASDRYYFDKYKLDLIEHRPNGQLLVYDPSSDQCSLLLDSLYFANGIAVDHEDEFVLIAETGAYRVSRYWLKGPMAGTSDLFIDNLPGFPDGISRGNDGIFWLTMVSPRKASLDWIMDKPSFRKILVRLPEPLQPKPSKGSMILGLDREGKVVHNFQDPNGAFGQITSVQQFGDKLYLGSLAEDGIGVFELGE